MGLIYYLPKKYIPIVRVNEGNLAIVSGYVSGLDLETLNTTGGATTAEQTPTVSGNSRTRQQWLDLLYVLRSSYPVTLSRIQAASEEVVDLDDLAFLWDLVINPRHFFDENDDLYFVINKNSAFQLEAMEFVIQGYSPAEATARALESIRTEVFVSREAMMIRINQMSEEHKKELRDVAASFDDPGNSSGASGAGYSTGSAGSKSRNNFTWLLIIGGILLLSSGKKKRK